MGEWILGAWNIPYKVVVWRMGYTYTEESFKVKDERTLSKVGLHDLPGSLQSHCGMELERGLQRGGRGGGEEQRERGKGERSRRRVERGMEERQREKGWGVGQRERGEGGEGVTRATCINEGERCELTGTSDTAVPEENRLCTS